MFEDSYFTPSEHTVIAIALVVISFGGVILNILVWIVVTRNKNWRNPMNILLLNQTLGNGIAALSINAYTFILRPDKLTSSKKMQHFICALTEGLGPFFICYISSYITLCAISYNRFVSIRYPLRANLRFTSKISVVFCILSWLTAFVSMIPSIIPLKYDVNLRICNRNWKSLNGTAYRIAALFLGIILPTLFLCLSYLAIFLSSTTVENQANSIQDIRRKRRLRKAERILGLLIFVYLVCWSPFFAYWAISTFTKILNQYTANGAIMTNRWLRCCVLIILCSSVVNPLINIFGCNEHKSGARAVMQSICQKLFPRTNSHVNAMNA